MVGEYTVNYNVCGNNVEAKNKSGCGFRPGSKLTIEEGAKSESDWNANKIKIKGTIDGNECKEFTVAEAECNFFPD